MGVADTKRSGALIPGSRGNIYCEPLDEREFLVSHPHRGQSSACEPREATSVRKQ